MIAQVRIAARICGTLTWKCSPTWPEDVDRDDHRRDVQPRIADARQDQRVARPAERERSRSSPGRPQRGRPFQDVIGCHRLACGGHSWLTIGAVYPQPRNGIGRAMLDAIPEAGREPSSRGRGPRVEGRHVVGALERGRVLAVAALALPRSSATDSYSCSAIHARSSASTVRDVLGPVAQQGRGHHRDVGADQQRLGHVASRVRRRRSPRARRRGRAAVAGWRSSAAAGAAPTAGSARAAGRPRACRGRGRAGRSG